MFFPMLVPPWAVAVAEVTTSWAEIASMAPLVIGMRSMRATDASSGPENLRMVSEKVAAAAESVMAVNRAATGMGMAAMFGRPTLDAPFVLAKAAAEPIRRRVRANVKRLSKSG